MQTVVSNARTAAYGDSCVDYSASGSIAKTIANGQADAANSPIQVIFVECDDFYRQAVETDLVAEGFAVHAFDDGEAMLAAIASGLQADVVVLDWGLESGPAIDLLSQMRERNLQWPVVFLTEQTNPVFERLALNRGAADFVDKARDTVILATRLRLAAVRTESRPIARNNPAAERRHPLEGILHCTRLTLRTATSRAYWDQVDVGLTLSEFKIVHLLAANVGSFITYRQIYDCMHRAGFVAGSGEHGYRTNVRSAIRRIREKFKALHPEFDEIQTFTSFGYCWGAPSKSGQL
jgi:two-component system response regulator ChvI